MVGLPDLTAQVKHSDGKLGQLLLFHSFFAYQDPVGKWWWGYWHKVD
jgi:hypothetical protein